jgi:conjugal transfer pilin signal peptidase TrbI
MRCVDQGRWTFVVAFIIALLIADAFWTVVSIGFDSHKERCLPDLHAALLVHFAPRSVRDGDLLFFRPSGALSGFHVNYILKEVAGVPGDHLSIHAGKVMINGHMVVEGFPLASYYHQPAAGFERDEIIPSGRFFMIGTHPQSNDSRYWGYLQASQVAGFAWRLW